MLSSMVGSLQTHVESLTRSSPLSSRLALDNSTLGAFFQLHIIVPQATLTTVKSRYKRRHDFCTQTSSNSEHQLSAILLLTFSFLLFVLVILNE